MIPQPRYICQGCQNSKNRVASGIPVSYNDFMKMWTHDYHRIEQAIRFIEDNVRRQPSLADVARYVGMSEFHFQRVFSRWAGVSPKKFLQFLTADYARSLLQESRNVLDVAYDLGLSGSARLHDLTIKLYAMTPGEIKTQGAALTIRYGVHPTPFGECFIAMTQRGICGLRFIEPGTMQKHVADLSDTWPHSRLVQDQTATGAMVQRIFATASRSNVSKGACPLVVRGTPFQIKVWEALLRIPSGHVVSYQHLARCAGLAGSTRAVGTAVGKNPVAYLIPCHRVIRSTGAFGEYRWGSLRKKVLLGWEAARKEGP